MKKKIIMAGFCAFILLVIAAIYYKSLKAQVDTFPQYKQKQTTCAYLKNRNESLLSSTELKDNLLIEKVVETTKAVKEDPKNIILNAKSACLLDAATNRLLYGKNADEEVPMASTTKIMTLLVTLENADLSETVTVSKNAARQPDVQLNMQTGDKYRLEDLLYSLMLESHNDTAVAVAEHVGGSVEGFAQMMNKKARELGCIHTNFVTPNGLDSGTNEHYTTARELAIISSYAIKNKKFVEITNTPNWNFKEIKSGRSYQVTNKDRFLYMYDGAIGIKTGFTNKAGYCFVGAVEKEGKTLISVVLGSGWPPNKNYKWLDTTKLMNYGMNQYQMRDIFDDSKLFNPLYIKGGKESYTDLYCEGSLTLLMNESDIVKVVCEIENEWKAPIELDEIVGYEKYYVNDEFIKQFPIKAMHRIEKIDFKYAWNQILDLWFAVEQRLY